MRPVPLPEIPDAAARAALIASTRGKTMVTMTLPRAETLALAAGALLLAGTTACTRMVEEPDREPRAAAVACPDFVAADTTFTVGPAGASIDIGGGHRLEFAAGAVAAPSRYRARRGPNSGSPRHWAELEIIPVDEAPSMFNGDVMLEISYAACPDEMGPSERPAVILRTTPPRRPLGGRDIHDRQVVRALLPHLTAFAIAR
jgi:hypothetical protein